MSKDTQPIMKQNLKYTSEYELYVTLLKLMKILKGWEITDYQITILTFYMRHGYSKDTKKLILENTDVKSVDSLNTQNCELTKKEFLITSERNKNMKLLSTELKKIKEFVEDKKKALLVEVLEG